MDFEIRRIGIFKFPPKKELKLKLKDLLEDNVDEKYFISDRMIKGFLEYQGSFDKKGIFLKTINNDETANTLTCNANTRVTDNYVKVMSESGDSLKRDLCNKLIEDGLVEEGDVVKHSYTQQILEGNKKCVEKNDGNMITLTTRGDCVGVCVEDKGNYYQWYQKGYLEHDTRAWKEEKVSETLCTKGGTKVAMNNLRIRKLTPKECFRLMGVKDKDFEKIAKNQSDSSLYHLAGDSIVCDVLKAIFKELL